MDSPVKQFLTKVAELPDPHAALDEIFKQCSVIELAALYYDWRNWWARPEQLSPEGDWSSWGGLTGRGWGKTRAMAEFVNQEVRAGRAFRVAIIAQKEEDCLKVMVFGGSGLIATSPPWFKARFFCGMVVWPNGAKAFIYTPEKPDGIYGHQHDLAWVSEIHAWPHTTMEQAFDNLDMGLREGNARMVWDSNPRPQHPILKLLLDQAKTDPDHKVFRGKTKDNADNINKKQLKKWENRYAGTQQGRMMLDGEQPEEEEGALCRQFWIDCHRRELPNKLKRKIVSVDPNTSMGKGTDQTGIQYQGLGYDDQIYQIEDLSGKHAWEEWGDIVLDTYELHRCDCVVVERNAGADACVANLRARAESKTRVAQGRELRIVKVKDDAITRYVQGTVYVKEVHARTGKTVRLEPVASLIEAGKVSFVEGVRFTKLELQLTTFVGAKGQKSPNNLDAFVWGVWELAGLTDLRDTSESFAGVETANRVLKSPPRSPSHLLFSAGRGRTI